jgi:cyclomaltodextrin glucanotransferase
LSAGTWRDAFSEQVFVVDSNGGRLSIDVPSHGVRVLLFDQRVTNPAMLRKLDRLQITARRRTP